MKGKGVTCFPVCAGKLPMAKKEGIQLVICSKSLTFPSAVLPDKGLLDGTGLKERVTSL